MLMASLVVADISHVATQAMTQGLPFITTKLPGPALVCSNASMKCLADIRKQGIHPEAEPGSKAGL